MFLDSLNITNYKNNNRITGIQTNESGVRTEFELSDGTLWEVQTAL